MTEKEKQLLLKDLSARLPYGVICNLSVKGVDVSITEKLEIGGLDHFIYGTMDVKPYLRPMSSLTDEEKKEIARIATYTSIIKITDELLEFCNSHHLDWRGLIEKSLAILAPDDMYK